VGTEDDAAASSRVEGPQGKASSEGSLIFASSVCSKCQVVGVPAKGGKVVFADGEAT